MASFFLVPPFSDTRPRYDMTSLKGRSWHFYRATNPLLMLETDATIAFHKSRIAEFSEMSKKRATSRSSVPYTDAELWYSRSVIEGCVHPTTHSVIFPLFRFAAFAPLNLLLVPLMLAPSTIASPKRTLGVHITNQTLNAVVNYANRSSDDIGLEKLAAAYVGAVVSSCTLALGASRLMARITDTASLKATLIRATLPFAACASAGIANLMLMRSEEWAGKGVPVRAAVAPLGAAANDDNKGELLGYSNQAGLISVGYCSLTRISLNVIVMSLPPLMMGFILKNKTLKAHPFLARQVEVALLGVMTLGAVPPCLALMKPVVTAPVVELEEKFRGLADAKGQPIEYVTFYKGL